MQESKKYHSPMKLRRFKRFFHCVRDSRGAGLSEYLIIALLVALIAVPSIKAFQESSTCQYNNANNQLAHPRRGDSLDDECPADDSDSDDDDYGDYDPDDPTTTVAPTSTIRPTTSVMTTSTIFTTSSIMTTSSIPTTTTIPLRCPTFGYYCGSYARTEAVGPECLDLCCNGGICLINFYDRNRIDCYCSDVEDLAIWEDMGLYPTISFR